MKHFLLIALFLTSCATSPFEANYKKIQANQTKDEVKLLLGEPADHTLKDGIETWIYKSHDKAIQFKDSKVIAYGSVDQITTPPPALAPAITQGLPLPTGLDIGERCESDKQCVSKNCHFKICSGENNCNARAGQVCANDQQCCTGFCDFSICKKKR